MSNTGDHAPRPPGGRQLPLFHKLWREVLRPFRSQSKCMSKPGLAVRLPPPPVELIDLDPERCTVEAKGIELLTRLVKQTARHPGPIVEIGTLLGITATYMALAKEPHQRIITVDNYSWNPWRLPGEQHFALARQILFYLAQTGHIQQVRQDKQEFFASYAGPPPSLVFLDALHTYEETKVDIQWAQRAGAHLIAGHDYSPSFPGVMRIVDECGGPSELGGSVWVLRPSTRTARSHAA